MFKHKQFDSNSLTKHRFLRRYIFMSLFLGTVKPLGLLFQHSNKSSVQIVNPHFTAASRLKSNQYMINTQNKPFYTIISHGAATGYSIWFQNFTLIRSQGLGPIKLPLMASIDSNIRKVLEMGIKPKYGENPTSKSLKKLSKTGVHA